MTSNFFHFLPRLAQFGLQFIPKGIALYLSFLFNLFCLFWPTWPHLNKGPHYDGATVESQPRYVCVFMSL